MFASIDGRTLAFGAFETSGEGTYHVVRDRRGTVVTGRIRTATGNPLSVTIIQPRSKGPARVHVGSAGRKPDFTARCEGRLPH
jgi:hypothetical protein